MPSCPHALTPCALGMLKHLLELIWAAIQDEAAKLLVKFVIFPLLVALGRKVWRCWKRKRDPQDQ